MQQSLGGNPTRLPSFDEARDEFTRNYLSQILQITTGNVSQAARLAKRNRTDFYKLLSRHQLLPDDFKKALTRGAALRGVVERRQLPIEFRDARDHMGELRLGEFRIDRQRQGLLGGALGVREIARRGAQDKRSMPADAAAPDSKSPCRCRVRSR